jgi:hypothetical protein
VSFQLSVPAAAIDLAERQPKPDDLLLEPLGASIHLFEGLAAFTICVIVCA